MKSMVISPYWHLRKTEFPPVSFLMCSSCVADGLQCMSSRVFGDVRFWAMRRVPALTVNSRAYMYSAHYTAQSIVLYR